MDINNTLFAFYGSLRKNMPLYNQFKHGLHYQFSIWISGFQLFSLGEFPCAVKSADDSDKILIEIFKADTQVAKEIDAIEMGYGYYQDEIEINEFRAMIYLFRHAANYPQVLDGDWVKFYGSKR